MADKDKGKNTAKKTAKRRVPNRMVKDSEAEAEAEDEDEGFKAKPKANSSSQAGDEEIEVEELVNGLVAVFGVGLGTVVDKTATVGTGLLSNARSAARPAVSAAMGGVIKICRIVDDTFGVKDPGFRDKK